MGDLLAFRDLRLSRLGAMAGGGGGSPSITSPGSIDAQPLVGQAVSLVEPTVTGADSVAYQWYNGPPPTRPISGWTSAIPTPTDTQYAFDLWRRARFTNATGDTVEDLQAPDVVGKTYSETWAAYSAVTPDTWTQLEPLYDRSGGITTTVRTQVDAPAGKALTVTASASSNRLIYLTAAAVFGAAKIGITTRTQGLFLFDHIGTQKGRYYLRFPNNALTSTGPGITVYDKGASADVRLQIDTDAAVDNLGTLLENIVVGTRRFLRIEMEGSTIRAKLWAYDATEPADFVERICTTSFSPATPFFGTRYAEALPADQFDLLYWSTGYDADAPFWSGYIPPPPDFSDAMVYAEPSAGTTASYFSGEIVFTMEDI